MIRKDRIFANLFAGQSIIPERLSRFGRFVAAALAKLPDAATYSEIITAILAAADGMSNEGSDVNVNLIEQKDDTSLVNIFVANFIDFMRENEMVIGGALGGSKSAGYKAYYPYGLTEYSQVTHTNMENVTKRLEAVTEKYGSKLAPDMAAALAGFKDGWDAVHGKQQGQMGTVQIDRTQFSAAYTKLQLVLTAAVHKVAFENPGNEELANKLFPFYMLYTESRKRNTKLAGTLAVNEIKYLMNRRLTTRVVFLVKNMEINSYICLWQSMTADGKPPVSAIVIKAGETKKIRASSLGDLTGTFLMIANQSAANAASYEITVSGLPKDKVPKAKKTAKQAVGG